MLKVTNKGTVALHDRYNGQDFGFAPGASVIIGEDAARHIFGVGEGDKIPTLVRLGWMSTNCDYEEAMRRLSDFVFSSADAPDPGEVQQPVAEPEPKQEQGLAPLQSGTPVESSTDGGVDSGVPIPPVAKGKRSVLDTLGG